MANANSTPVSKMQSEAIELLDKAADVARFIQGITLNHDINLEGDTVTGFYVVMGDLIDRIRKAEALIQQVAP